MSRTFSFLIALGGTWLWYGGLHMTSQLAEPMVTSQRILFARLGAFLPLPTRMWITLNDLHVPLVVALLITLVLIVVERTALNRDLIHTLALTLLIGYSAFSSVVILAGLANMIGAIR